MQENKQEKSLIKQNISLYLAKKGVTPYEFYKKSGVTRGVLAQNNGISEDNLSRFLAYAPDVNPSWLLTGRGEMLKTKRIPDDIPPQEKPNLDIKDTNNPPHTQEKIDISSSDIIAKLVATIQEQAEEIGQLRERIAQLQREKGKNASDAQSSGIANAG